MKMKMKKIVGLTLAGLMAVSLCACGSAEKGGSEDQADAAKTRESTEEAASGTEESAGTEAAAESADAGELTEIDVVLDWYPNAIHTFLYEAIDNGYFEETGLKVNLISPAESVDSITFVATGKAQIGLTYPIEIVQANDNDMPVKALAAVSQKALDCMCSLASNDGITEDMSSLKGKTVGYSGTAAAEAIMRTIAKNAGLTDSDYELLDVGFDLVTSLTTESVDLVIGTFVNDEVVTMENAGYELNVYPEQDYGVPEIYGLVMAVNEDDYNAQPEVYTAFLDACRKGFADMCADEDAALDLIMSEMNSDDNPLDETQQRESYEILMERMQTEDAEFLSMSSTTWQEIIDWMVESDLAEKEFTAADVTIACD